VKYLKTTITLAAVLVLALAAASVADVLPSPWSKKFLGDAYYNGNLAPIGSIIDAYTPGGVHCGTFMISNNQDSAGVYGNMFVYGDDIHNTDPGPSGALYGEEISFKVNGRDATPTVISGDLLWRDKETARIDLAVDDAIIALSMTDAPSDLEGGTPSTIRFWIGVQNDGNGLDFYSVNVTPTLPPALGWTVTPAADPVYANPGEIVYTYFDVEVPTWPDTELVNLLDFEVYSHLDPTANVTGSVNATANAAVVFDVSLIKPLLEDRLVVANEIVHLEVRFSNDGNTADAYYIEAQLSDTNWTVTVQAGAVSLDPGEGGLLLVQVTVPDWVDDGEVNEVSYSIISTTDPNVTADGVVELTVQEPTDVWESDLGLLPGQIALAQNYPNPFNPSTTIAFNLPSHSKVSLSIINVLGQTVDQVELGSLSAGIHRIDYNASAMASGMYFYRIETDFGSETRKMVLLK
jgi:hypothetical protein